MWSRGIRSRIGDRVSGGADRGGGPGRPRLRSELPFQVVRDPWNSAGQRWSLVIGLTLVFAFAILVLVSVAGFGILRPGG
jgi:hypothetical protein